MSSERVDYSRYARMPSRRLEHIPGDRGLPLLGHTLGFVRDFPRLVNSGYEKYGPVYRSNAFFQDVIVLLGPEANRAVLNDTEKHFSNSLAWNPTLEKFFPNGLMLKDFEEHRYHRRILQSAFKKQAVESYLAAMGPQLAAGLDDWPVNREFHFLPQIKSLLLDVAAQTFLGLDMGAEAEAINRAFVAAVAATTAIVRVPLAGNRWSRGLAGRRQLEDFVNRQLPEKRASGAADFFGQLCRAVDEDGNQLADQAIVDHLIFLLFAAHDTTSSTLCSVVYALAKNPQWQETLRDEYAGLDPARIDYQALAKMTASGMVFREALRMYPPLPTIPRRCLRETEILGHRIPENAAVGISPLFTHYMDEFWSAPGRFDPLRFSPQRAEHKRHAYQFVPFGGGAHKCLGLNFAEIQVKLFLCAFLQRYDVGVAEDYSMKFSVVPLSLPTDGLPVTITPRQEGPAAQ